MLLNSDNLFTIISGLKNPQKYANIHKITQKYAKIHKTRKNPVKNQKKNIKLRKNPADILLG